jgi:hypothetical protein
MQSNSTPRDPKDRKKGEGYDQPNRLTEREGGDDALEYSSPADTNSDEKVIVNEQRSNKTVNTPSQTSAHSSELEATDEDILN